MVYTYFCTFCLILISVILNKILWLPHCYAMIGQSWHQVLHSQSVFAIFRILLVL